MTRDVCRALNPERTTHIAVLSRRVHSLNTDTLLETVRWTGQYDPLTVKQGPHSDGGLNQ